VQANGGRRAMLRDIPRASAHAGAGATRPRARSDKRPRPLPDGPAKGANDEDGGWGGVDDPLSSALAALRCASSRRAPAPAVYTRMMEALSACVRRACGLPSSTPIGRRASSVNTVMVGDPASRSRAIVVRVGSGKADAAILWSSFRGGILCSCFAGTQNNLFISASSPSSVCKHTTALRSCLSRNGSSLDTFWRRMHLGSSPANVVCRQPYGSMRFWVVLCRSVYSLVSFTAASVATCIAPSCRCFRARCGHVALARPLNMEHRAMDASDAAKDPCAKVGNVKPAAAVDGAPVPHEPADEDVGIASDPGDEDRVSSDAAAAAVAARVRRSLLPCVGEIQSAVTHVITLGFRCPFRAESVGEALSIVLERFPQLSKVIFQDVACKLDKNARRRVRPILRSSTDNLPADVSWGQRATASLPLPTTGAARSRRTWP